MSELEKKYLNVKSMRSDYDASGHICDDYISELKEIIRDKIVDYDELKFENNRLSEKVKQLEQEKAELIRSLSRAEEILSERGIRSTIIDSVLIKFINHLDESQKERIKKHS